MNTVKKIIYLYLVLTALTFLFIGDLLLNINNNLEIIFFDIGQGDSALIKTSSGFNIIIDGGPDDSLIYRLSNYLNYFDREIDLVILTHPDSDHITGLGELFARYKIQHVLLSGQADDLSVYQFLLQESKKTQIFYSQNIDTIKIDSDTWLDILHPKNNYHFSNNNDYSVVVKLHYKDSTFLFTGDISKEVEGILPQQSIVADILKISHHGSKTSSSLGFLQKVDPDYAVISSGQNKYGHPHQVVLDNLEELSINYLLTKDLGDIVFYSDGHQIWLKD